MIQFALERDLVFAFRPVARMAGQERQGGTWRFRGEGPMARETTVARAAMAVALLSVAQIGVGLLLISLLGGTSGQDLGQGAAPADWGRAVPVLVAAEILKMLIAAAQILVVRGLAGQAGRALPLTAAIVGIAGALLVATSGILGLAAVAVRDPALGAPTSVLGFLGLAATGIWAVLVAYLKPLPLKPWLLAVAWGLGASSILALAFHQIVVIAGLLSLLWWFGLAQAAKRA